MAASNSRALFLTVGGTVDPLTLAMKAGKSVVREFGDEAINTVDEVNKAFGRLGGNDIAASARALESSYSKTFANIRANAEQALGASTNGAAVQIVNANAAAAAAAEAEKQAAALRLVADAAQRAADATTGDTAAARQYATQVAALALGAEQFAVGLRSQAAVLGSVNAELAASGVTADKAGEAHNRMGASTLIADHVIRSFGDSIAAGQSPIRAFTLEVGRIGEAMQLFALQTNATEGFVAKFAGFMSGGFGLALTIGLSTLAPLVSKIFEEGAALDDAVAKLRTEAAAQDASTAAHAAFNRTIEGQIALQRQLTAELDKAIQTDRQQQQHEVLTAQNNLDNQRKSRDNLVKQIAQAQADLRTLEALAASPVGAHDTNSNAQLNATRATLEKLQAQLAQTKVSIAASESDVRKAQIPLIKDDVAASFDAKTAAALRYQKQLEELTNRLNIGPGNKGTVKALQGDGTFKSVTVSGIDQEQYRAGLAAITAARAAAEAAADAAKREVAASKQVGRTVTLSQAEDIVHSIGGRVTSAQRSYSEQQVLYDRYKAGEGPLAAKPGTSQHEQGTALDIAKQAGLTLGAIKKAFEDKGVRLTEALDEGDHYHVGFGKKGSRGPSAETLAKREEAAKRKDANDDRGYQSEVGAAQQRIARAQEKVADTIEERYQVATDELTAAQKQRDREIDDELKAGKFGDPASKEAQAKAANLKKLVDEGTRLDKVAETKKFDDQIADRQLEIDRQSITGSIALLQLQQDLATTTSQRRALAHQILDKEQQLAREELQNKISKEDDPAKKAALQGQLTALPTEYALKGKAVDKQNADPMQQYVEQLHAHVDDMNSALSGVKADALQNLEDGLIGIVSGTESVASAFKKMASSIIADLARIAIEKLIVKVIGGGIFADGTVPGHATGMIPGFATGLIDGVIHGPGSGRSDSILAFLGGKPIRVSNGESIITERATKKYGPILKAMNDNSLPMFAAGMIPASSIFYPQLPTAKSLAPQQAQPMQIMLRVAKGEAFDAEVIRVSGPHTVQIVQEAAPTIIDVATMRTVDALTRPRV